MKESFKIFSDSDFLNLITLDIKSLTVMEPLVAAVNNLSLCLVMNFFNFNLIIAY